MNPPIRFRFSRSDYVGMSVALARTPLWRRVAIAALAVAVVFLFGVAGDAAGRGGSFRESLRALWGDLVSGGAPALIYVLFALIAALTLCRHWLSGVVAFALYRRQPIAETDHEIRLSEAGIDIVTPLLSSTIAWPAVKRVIETPRLFLIAISARQAVVVPRRAFETEAAFQSMRAFVQAHLSLPAASPR